MVQEYENVAHPGEKRDAEGSTFYKDLLGKVKYFDVSAAGIELRVKSKDKRVEDKTNDGDSGFVADMHEENKRNENIPESQNNKNSEGANANTSRGFGRNAPSSPALVGKHGKRSKAKSPRLHNHYKLEITDFEFLLDISRSDLETGDGEARDADARVFRRILSRGIAKAIRADELGYSVK